METSVTRNNKVKKTCFSVIFLGTQCRSHILFWKASFWLKIVVYKNRFLTLFLDILCTLTILSITQYYTLFMISHFRYLPVFSIQPNFLTFNISRKLYFTGHKSIFYSRPGVFRVFNTKTSMTLN